MEILNKILKNVSLSFGISEEEIKGESRLRDIKIARHVYCYIAKKYTFNSLKKIGELINRDHSSVIYAVTMIENDIQLGFDKKLLRKIEILLIKLSMSVIILEDVDLLKMAQSNGKYSN